MYLCLFFFDKTRKSTKTNEQIGEEASWLLNMMLSRNAKLTFLAMYGDYCGLKNNIQKYEITKNKLIVIEENKRFLMCRDISNLLELGDVISILTKLFQLM